MRWPFIFVAIPFKGEIPLLLECVNSLFPSYIKGFAYSMVLWDDGSTDEELNSLYFSLPQEVGIPIVKHDNVGYTQAIFNIFEDVLKNRSEFDYILLMNSDVKFRKNTLYSLVSRMLSNVNVAAVGCKVLKYGTTEIAHTGTRLENGEIVDPYCGLEENDPRTCFVERRLWVNGCCVLYNAKILRKLNLNFDLHFKPAYFEEADLMTKLVLRGYSVLYDPRAVIEHVINATMGKEKEKYEKIFWENWEKYLERWKPYFSSKQLQF